jgi:hypothetical protein
MVIIAGNNSGAKPTASANANKIESNSGLPIARFIIRIDPEIIMVSYMSR